MKTTTNCKQCAALVLLDAVVTGLHGEAFCSPACAASYRAEFDAFITAEIVAAVVRFKSRTPAQKQRVTDYNQWAAAVSQDNRDSRSAHELPAVA